MSTASDFENAVSTVDSNTLSLLPMWMQNWAANLQKARNGESLDKLFRKPPSERVVVVGRGPSIRKHGHLGMLRSFPGQVVASDGALPLIAEKGVMPYASVTVDGSEAVAKWFEGPTKRLRGLKAILPVTASPKTVRQAESIGAHIHWYIGDLDHEPLRGITDILQLQTYSPANPTGVSRLNAAGNSGLAAVIIAVTIMRAKEVVLVGMDGGYPPDTPLDELHYHTGIVKSAGFNEKQAATLYRVYYHPTLKYCVVDPVFEIYRRTFLRLVEQASKQGVKVINASEGGCLWGENVRISTFADCLKGSDGRLEPEGRVLTEDEFSRLVLEARPRA